MLARSRPLPDDGSSTVTAPRRSVVGSRKSPLSQVQTKEVLSQLRRHFPGHDFVVKPISTSGDRSKQAPLADLERGAFAKEIELALLDGEIDFAVHSAKDLPAELPDGLAIAATVRRQDPGDALVDRWGLALAELPPEARIGTSSPRRTAQLLAIRPDLRVLPIRGNVGTRLDKARGGDYDGVVLAAAGLIRLGRQAEISEHLSTGSFTPDVGQGTLAIETRADDLRTIEMLAYIDHRPTSLALDAERAFLGLLGGGCQVPVAAYARLDGSLLRISTMAALPDGSRVFRTEATYDADEPAEAGERAARALLAQGASEIIHGGQDPPATPASD